MQYLQQVALRLLLQLLRLLLLLQQRETLLRRQVRRLLQGLIQLNRHLLRLLRLLIQADLQLLRLELVDQRPLRLEQVGQLHLHIHLQTLHNTKRKYLEMVPINKKIQMVQAVNL